MVSWEGPKDFSNLNKSYIFFPSISKKGRFFVGNHKFKSNILNAGLEHVMFCCNDGFDIEVFFGAFPAFLGCFKPLFFC